MPSDLAPAPISGPVQHSQAEAWEDPPSRRLTGNDAPVLTIDGFEGPLDWLLDMARARKIDLARLSILALVEAFADALEAALGRQQAAGLRLMAWGDWLVMASTLTLLRSRLLLPADGAAAEAARDEAEALRRQLLDRKQIATAVDWLERRPQLGRDVFGREAFGRATGDRAAGAAGRVGDVTELFRACLVALRLPDAAEEFFRPRPPLWTMPQAAARIRAMLPGLGERGGPFEAFLPPLRPDIPDRPLRCRAAVAGTFAATLELARDGTLRLEQAGAGLVAYAAAPAVDGSGPREITPAGRPGRVRQARR